MKLKVYNKNQNAPKPNQPLLPGACAVVVNQKGQVFMHKRNDNNFWAIPGGKMEIGESISQCCIREIKEEAGIDVTIKKLIGIYTSPKCVFAWKDGKNNKKVCQSFVVAFLCRAKQAQVSLNNESVAFKWFSPDAVNRLKTLPFVKEIIRDALRNKSAYFD
ncbi:MAG: NUDIX domain-containing protein [bacterium]